MKTFLKIITYIFQPLLMPTLGMILLMQLSFFQLLGLYYQILAIIGTFLFTALFPALPILWMLRKGQINDVFISRREERTMPYLFAFLAYFFWVLFIWRTLRFPPEFLMLAIGSVLSLIFMIIINMKWKISAHAAGVGGIVGAIFVVSYLLSINPIGLIIISLIISGLVAISRIYLKAHTLSQTIGGFCLGVLTLMMTETVYILITK